MDWGVHMRFRRTAVIAGTFGIGSALAVAAVPAGATPGQGAHFASASDRLDGDQLAADFRELGLGSSLPTEVLSADAAVSYVCGDVFLDPSSFYHDSFQFSMAQNSHRQVSQAFGTDGDGQAVGTLELPSVGAPCPAGTENVGRETIDYTNVVLADQSNGVSVALAPQSYAGQTLP